jgi:hypothetical protein
MSITHAERSIALADQITAKAEEAVADLDCEMALRKWPAEFRAIMWDAVALVAAGRAAAARS